MGCREEHPLTWGDEGLTRALKREVLGGGVLGSAVFVPPKRSEKKRLRHQFDGHLSVEESQGRMWPPWKQTFHSWRSCMPAI